MNSLRSNGDTRVSLFKTFRFHASEDGLRNGMSVASCVVLIEETTALWRLNEALREAEIGNREEARKQIMAIPNLDSTRNLRIYAAFALARAGDIARAQTMADALNRDAPLNTMLIGYWLPTIRASIELNRKHFATAAELLQNVSAYEMGGPQPSAQLSGTLYPIYVRAEAFLKAGQGEQAAAELQKIIDHRGIVNVGLWLRSCAISLVKISPSLISSGNHQVHINSTARPQQNLAFESAICEERSGVPNEDRSFGRILGFSCGFLRSRRREGRRLFERRIDSTSPGTLQKFCLSFRYNLVVFSGRRIGQDHRAISSTARIRS